MPRACVRLLSALDEIPEVRDRILTAIAEEPPANLADGGTIRPGFHAGLDELRDISRNSRQYIAQIELRERARTGIQSLKVRFNNVFGYYIEISKANLHHAPSDYERKQTLVNAERFTTPELKELESKVLDAEDKMLTLEREIFQELRLFAAEHAARIRQTAAAIAELDVTCALAQVAAENRYVRPSFTDSGEIRIVAGRHPVIEKLTEKEALRFIPNDLYFDTEVAIHRGDYGAEHGRQIDLFAAGRGDRDSGADGFVRAGGFGCAAALWIACSRASARPTIWRAGDPRSWWR